MEINPIEVLTLLFSGLTLYVVLRASRDQHLAILEGLREHLLFLKENARGQKAQFVKNIPSWTILNLDITHYLSYIPSHVRQRWGVTPVNTHELKKRLIETAGHVNTINNILQMVYAAHVAGQGKRKKEFLHDLQNNTYYSNLSEAADDCIREIDMILGRIIIEETKAFVETRRQKLVETILVVGGTTGGFLTLIAQQTAPLASMAINWFVAFLIIGLVYYSVLTLRVVVPGGLADAFFCYGIAVSLSAIIMIMLIPVNLTLAGIALSNLVGMLVGIVFGTILFKS